MCLFFFFLTIVIFTFLNRTQGLVSSAEALGVATDKDEDKSTGEAEPSPVLDRAALYRLARLGLFVEFKFQVKRALINSINESII